MFVGITYSVVSIIFDLDDTLVRLNDSRAITMHRTIQHCLHQDIAIKDVKDARKRSNERDDIVFIDTFLRERGVQFKNIDTIYRDQYFITGSKVETMLVGDEVLDRLNRKYELFIASNRPRELYDGVWSDKFSQYFKGVVCYGDFADVKRKPDPSIIIATINKYLIPRPVFYVGNHPTDMIAAKSAGVYAVGITTTHSKSELEESGAECVIDSIEEIEKCILSIRINRTQSQRHL